MKKIKILIISIIVVIALFLTFFITDYTRSKKDLKPIFSVYTTTYEDGGSKKYVGLFYNYYKVRKINPDINMDEVCNEDCYLTDYVITPWFFDLDYAKSKAFSTKNKMIDKYNVTLYSDINNSLNNTFVKEHITNGSYYEDVIYEDENIPKEYTILVQSQDEVNKIFNEIPFEFDLEKQNILIYIYTTNYNSAKLELTNAKLENNTLSFCIKEKLGGIGTGSATIPITKVIVLTIDKIENCSYSFIVK